MIHTMGIQLTKQYTYSETFYQDYSDVPGMPSHWCVQYYEVGGDGFPLYHYCDTVEEADKFEKELKDEK